MANLYDNLGKMLNDVLETGVIPQINDSLGENEIMATTKKTTAAKSTTAKKTTTAKTSTAKKTTAAKTTTAKKKTAASTSSSKKSGIDMGTVLKAVNTIKNFQIPDEVKSALKLLNISFPCKLEDVKKQYHDILKAVHPDTAEKKDSSVVSSAVSSVVKKVVSSKTSVDDITGAYKTVEGFLKNFKL